MLGNDSDVDGDTLTVTSASVDPARGSVSVNPDGTLAFTPVGNLSGPVLVSYTVSDGQGGFATATVTVNVGPNTPPTGTNALVVISEDGSRSFSATDFGFSDADAGQSFANVRIDVLPAAGTLTLSGVNVVAGQVIGVADLGNLVYAPAPNAHGSGYASFGFSVQDSAGAFDTVPNQITIDVTPVADSAVIGGAASGATIEDTTVSTGGTLTVTDPDAGEAAFNPLANVAGAHGTFSIDAAGVWTRSRRAGPRRRTVAARRDLHRHLDRWHCASGHGDHHRNQRCAGRRVGQLQRGRGCTSGVRLGRRHRRRCQRGAELQPECRTSARADFQSEWKLHVRCVQCRLPIPGRRAAAGAHHPLHRHRRPGRHLRCQSRHHRDRGR